jgi:hypothetical protein
LSVQQRRDVYHLPAEAKRLTQQDQDFVRTLKTACQIDEVETFSSDTFRMLGLDRFLVDKEHGIGGVFARLKANGIIEEVGWTRSSFPSNHGRKIRVYKFLEGGKS